MKNKILPSCTASPPSWGGPSLFFFTYPYDTKRKMHEKGNSDTLYVPPPPGGGLLLFSSCTYNMKKNDKMKSNTKLPPGSPALGGPVLFFMADQAISKYKYVRTTYILPPAVSENLDISRYNDYDIYPHPAVSIIKYL